MPFYEYQCSECMHRWDENRQAGHRDIESVCPACEVGFAKRKLGAGVRMAEVKGTGNGRIGRSIEERAELGAKRKAEWK